MTWFTIEPVPGKHATYSVRVKWWHPGFWLYGYRTLRAAGASVLESIWFTVVLIRQFEK